MPKKVPWNGHYLDVLAGDQFDPEYLKLNPKAVVPTIVHDGTVVIESTVICEYLNDVYPDPALRPADPAGRARMRIWTKIVDEILHPSIVDITFVVSRRHTVLAKGEENTRRFIEDAPDVVSRERRQNWIHGGYDSTEVQQAVENYRKALIQMEDELENGPWLAGEAFSLADIGVIPYINRLHMLNMGSMWQDRHPRIADWFDRLRARDSFHAGIEEHLPAESRAALLRNGHDGGPALLKACGL
ncbi:MAG: glutathione S-transferase family protein [Alphaproteobacteria bacterium]